MNFPGPANVEPTAAEANRDATTGQVRGHADERTPCVGLLRAVAAAQRRGAAEVSVLDRSPGMGSALSEVVGTPRPRAVRAFAPADGWRTRAWRRPR